MGNESTFFTKRYSTPMNSTRMTFVKGASHDTEADQA